MRLQALDHVALSVRNVEVSAQWYVDVLGLERQHDEVWKDTPVFVGKNGAGVALFPIRGNEALSSRGSPRILHFAFRTARPDFVAAQEELRKRGIEFEFQ